MQDSFIESNVHKFNSTKKATLSSGFFVSNYDAHLALCVCKKLFQNFIYV